jgi:hypothetical protein
MKSVWKPAQFAKWVGQMALAGDFLNKAVNILSLAAVYTRASWIVRGQLLTILS